MPLLGGFEEQYSEYGPRGRREGAPAAPERRRQRYGLQAPWPGCPRPTASTAPRTTSPRCRRSRRGPRTAPYRPDQGPLYRHGRHRAHRGQRAPARRGDGLQGPGPHRRTPHPLHPHPLRREVNRSVGVAQAVPRAQLGHRVDRDRRGLLGTEAPLVDGSRRGSPDRRSCHERRHGQGERHAESRPIHLRPPSSQPVRPSLDRKIGHGQARRHSRTRRNPS